MTQSFSAVLLRIVEQFFCEVDGCPTGILLSDRWLGRPWDNYYTFTSSSLGQSGELAVDFEEGYHLKFHAKSFSYIVHIEERSIDLSVEIDSGTMKEPPDCSLNLGPGTITFRAALGPRNSEEVESGDWIQVFSDIVARISKAALTSRWG